MSTRLDEASRQKAGKSNLPDFLAQIIIDGAAARKPTHDAWLRAYDPFKIRLAANRVETETAYGQPHFVVQEDDSGREIHAFGPAEILWRDKTRVHLGPVNKRFWVAIVYEDDVVTRIFSNDLFNDMRIATSENEVKKTKTGEPEN